MPEPFEPSDQPTEPPPGAERHRAILLGAILFLAATALVVLFFVPSVPLPVRLFIVVCDIVAATALALVLRHRSSDD